MNVFILCTGRCGSRTFIQACRHITNYTAGHESRWGKLGPDRLSYPDNHIEADNRLSWMLGRLDLEYRDTAFFVHLKRSENLTAYSFARRQHGIIDAYRKVIVPTDPSTDILDVALDYVRTVNANIEHFLYHSDTSMQMEFYLEEAKEDFKMFWEYIDAEGDLDAALAEWDIHYNESPGPAIAHPTTAEYPIDPREADL